jgi:hypothetical protein
VTLSRRSFFTKLAGAAVAVKAAPALVSSASVYTWQEPVTNLTTRVFFTCDGKALAQAALPHIPAVLQREGL